MERLNTMKKYELSKYDFAILDVALNLAITSQLANIAMKAKAEQIQAKFRAARTGWLEIEEN